MKLIIMVILAYAILKTNSVTGLGKETSGPFFIIPKRISPCKDMGKESIRLGFKTERYNRTALIWNSNFTVPFNLGSDVYLRIILHKKASSGGWNSVLDVTMNFCDNMNYFTGDIWRDILNRAGVEYTGCPIKKGFYEVKNYVTDFNKLRGIPTWEFGEYIIETVIFTKNGIKRTRETCVQFTVEMRPMYEFQH